MKIKSSKYNKYINFNVDGVEYSEELKRCYFIGQDLDGNKYKVYVNDDYKESILVWDVEKI